MTGFVEDIFIPPQGNEDNKKETMKSLFLDADGFSIYCIANFLKIY
ncbi:hypothetical protein [Salmonella phage SD-1_S14]|nr:hypothetical protein [Salmonella phage SD-2_S15]WPK19458.1 hypothetical protein [Salmonella phage SD-6_S16]WPK20129.1 hypothetical protein [Salmonella phage SD-1_S14]WPK21139.1 hypothetical protein [Salmonella phage SD-15_S21]